MEEDVDAEGEAKEEIGELNIADAPKHFPTLLGGNRYRLCHEFPLMFPIEPVASRRRISHLGSVLATRCGRLHGRVIICVHTIGRLTIFERGFSRISSS